MVPKLKLSVLIEALNLEGKIVSNPVTCEFGVNWTAEEVVISAIFETLLQVRKGDTVSKTYFNTE